METIDKNQTIDETKKKLKDNREQLEAELEYQLQDIQKDATAFAKQALVVAGGVYLSYRLIKAITSKKETKQDKRYRKIGKKLGVQQKKNDSEGLGYIIMHGLITTVFTVLSHRLKQSLTQDRSVNDSKKHS